MSGAPAAAVQELDQAAVSRLLPVRQSDAHKQTHGRLVVVAGSLDYLGAGLLTTLAAVRAGAGLVCLCVPASLQGLVAGRVPEAITAGLAASDLPPLIPAMRRHLMATRAGVSEGRRETHAPGDES